MKRILIALSLVLFTHPANATTIAYDGKILAADSQSTCGGRKWLDGRKKIQEIGDFYVAGSGVVFLIDKFISIWREKDKDTAKKEVSKLAESEDGVCFIIVHKVTGKFSVIYINHDKVSEHHDRRLPFAIGSGDDYAMGAMGAGKTADEAVGIAAQHDLFTGGNIQSVSIK